MHATAYVADMAGAHEFGIWLDARMEETGWTQARLARTTGVAQSQISRYRNGEMTPDPATIRKLALALDSDVEEMMVLAGHVVGDERRAARTYIVRTDDPKVHQLFRVVGEVAEDAKPAEIEQIKRVLRAFKRDEK